MQYMPNNMHNMPNDNMQNNMQINMQNMLAICRFGSDCLVLTVICRICKILCSICPICYDDFQYAQYALPTLLMSQSHLWLAPSGREDNVAPGPGRWGRRVAGEAENGPGPSHLRLAPSGREDNVAPRPGPVGAAGRRPRLHRPGGGGHGRSPAQADEDGGSPV